MSDSRAEDFAWAKDAAVPSAQGPNSLELLREANALGTAQGAKSELPNLLLNRPDLKPTDWTPPPAVLADDVSKRALLIATQKDGAKENKTEEAKKAANEVARTAERNRVVAQLSASDCKQLDTMRLELAVASGTKERELKQAEISAFLTPKLTNPVSDSGISEIMAPQPPAELLKEIKSARPEEVKELIKDLRAKVLSDSAKAISDPKQQKDFADKVAAFEARAAQRGLADSEVLGTYLQIGRVLNPSAKLEHGSKAVLAHSMLANVADPTSIDQGGHNTCNVTTMQVRLSAQEPALASKVVADVAVGGSFTSADGTVVKPLNLDPDGEARTYPGWDGSRNYASQIFQLTAINIYWNRRDTMPGGKTVGKGNIQYAQDGSGEYLLDTSVNPPQKQTFETMDANHPWLDIYGVSEINQQITGKASKDFGIHRWIYPSESDGVSKIVTLGGFKERLLELKKANSFPVIIEVDASKKPFGDGKGFGPHVVTITDYDAEKGLVTVDNQWGKSDDHTGQPGQKPKVPIEEIWSSMSLLPSLDFFTDKIKHGFDGLKWQDSIRPTITAASAKGLEFGLSAAAPIAVRGGLGYLSEWGVPGAARALEFSESRLGSASLRVGTSLAALGAFAYMNDLPAAFKQGNSFAAGKITRITGDWASFEIGRQLVGKTVSWVPWAPARFGLSVAGGIATTTVFDKLLGEGSEIAGSKVYDVAREYLGTRYNKLPDSPKSFTPKDLIPIPKDPTPEKGPSHLGNTSMTKHFSERRTTLFQTYPGMDHFSLKSK